MNQNLIDAGCAGKRVTLKSDGLQAAKALKRALVLKRGCETSIIHSPARESKSNGAVERARSDEDYEIAFGGQAEDSNKCESPVVILVGSLGLRSC